MNEKVEKANEEKYEVVNSVAGLYDEVEEAKVYDVNKRSKICLKHEWINAHLHLTEVHETNKEYSIYLQGDDGERTFRFCKKCKKIDCLHLFDNVNYRRYTDEFYYISYTIGTCKRCGLRILTQTCGCCNPSNDALTLINEVIVENGLNYNQYGSYYMCEYPVEISRRLKTQNRDSVKSMIVSELV